MDKKKVFTYVNNLFCLALKLSIIDYEINMFVWIVVLVVYLRLDVGPNMGIKKETFLSSSSVKIEGREL